MKTKATKVKMPAKADKKPAKKEPVLLAQVGVFEKGKNKFPMFQIVEEGKEDEQFPPMSFGMKKAKALLAIPDLVEKLEAFVASKGASLE